MAPHFPARCARCGLGITPALAYDAGGDTVCPHCYPGDARDRAVRPDPGLPRPP